MDSGGCSTRHRGSFCSTAARNAPRGLDRFNRHQSIPISQSCARILASPGDIDIVTVPVEQNLDAAGLLTPETRRAAARRLAFGAASRAPRRRKFSGGERCELGREAGRTAGAPVNAEMRALSQRHRKLPLREQGLPQRRRLPGLPTGRRRPRSLASMACSLRAPRSRCTDAAARRDH